MDVITAIVIAFCIIVSVIGLIVCLHDLTIIIARYHFRVKYLRSLGFVLKERYKRVDWKKYRLERYYYKAATNQCIKVEHIFSWDDSKIYDIYNINVSGISTTWII